MQCVHCGANVAGTAKFCQNCGKLATKAAVSSTQNICPSCRIINSTGAKFCKNCGTRLNTPSAASTEVSAPSYFCPNCGAALKKEPKKKTTCPSCKKPIYVRSRPIDRKKLLVTQEQAEDIEHEWAVTRELEALPEADKNRFEQMRAAQLEEHGKEMPKQLHIALHSIRRQSYKQQGLKHIEEGDFGLFRNTRLDAALLLDEEGKTDEEKLTDALATYLELCYIDLNGPRNSTKLETLPIPQLTDEQKHALAQIYKEIASGKGKLTYEERADLAARTSAIMGGAKAAAEHASEAPQQQRKNFESSEGDLAIGIVASANRIIERLTLTKNEVKTLFQEHNSKYLSGLNLPLSIDDAWKELEPDLVFEH